jgi:hypothetical protein
MSPPWRFVSCVSSRFAQADWKVIELLKRFIRERILRHKDGSPYPKLERT